MPNPTLELLRAQIRAIRAMVDTLDATINSMEAAAQPNANAAPRPMLNPPTPLRRSAPTFDDTPPREPKAVPVPDPSGDLRPQLER